MRVVRVVLGSLLILICLAAWSATGLMAVHLTDEQRAWLEQKGTLILAGDKDYPPFEFMEGDVYRGFNTDIARALGLELGVDIHLVPLPWNQAIAALSAGRIDALLGMKYSAERAQFYAFSRPHFDTASVIFVRRDEVGVDRLESLKGQRIAVQSGDYAHDFLRGDPAYTLITYPSQGEAFAALLSGQVVAFIGNRNAGLYYTRTHDAYDLVKIIGTPVGEVSGYCMAVRRDDQMLLSILDAGLVALEESGMKARIYQRWFGEQPARPGLVPLATIILLAAIGAVGATVVISRAWTSTLRTEVRRRTEQLTELNQELVELTSLQFGLATIADPQSNLKPVLDRLLTILGGAGGAVCLGGPGENHTSPIIVGLSPLELADAVAQWEKEGQAAPPCSVAVIPSSHYPRSLLVVKMLPGRLSVYTGNLLKVMGRLLAATIDNRVLYCDLEASYVDTIQALAEAIEARDPYTRGHCLRTTQTALAVGRRAGLSAEKLGHLRQAALLHDVGKIGVSDRILLKPGPLTSEEWDLMKQHPVFGVRILQPIKFLSKAIPIVYHHHERWDGEGYPDQLKREEIPLGARIVSICDAYEAMTSDRPYRAAFSHERALETIARERGKQFDPELVPLFLSLPAER
ncbi:MAG: transporter substrate-binding domain-containing protein [Bacillota bacterium]